MRRFFSKAAAAPTVSARIGRPNAHVKLALLSKSDKEPAAFLAAVKASVNPAIDATPRVVVRDPRVASLSALHNPKKTTYASLAWYDASSHLDESPADALLLGRNYLSHLLSSDGLVHVSLGGQTQAAEDFEMMLQDMLQRDRDVIQKRSLDLDKKLAKKEDERSLHEKRLLNICLELLEKDKRISDHIWTEQEAAILTELNFITAKPVMHVVMGGNCTTDKIYLDPSASLKPEATEDEAQIIIKKARESVGLIDFFTAGQDEVRAWPVLKNTKAPKAAAEIHSDFEGRFIAAEIFNLEEYLKNGGESKCKVKNGNKDYIVQDGDIINFKLGPKKSSGSKK